MNQVTGTLLHAGYEFDDGLKLDLYGEKDEDGNCVESVAVHGSKVEICQLFRPKQLENMGYWLLKDDANPTNREWAQRHKEAAASYHGLALPKPIQQ